jgi:hypothetical protein
LAAATRHPRRSAAIGCPCDGIEPERRMCRPSSRCGAPWRSIRR